MILFLGVILAGLAWAFMFVPSRRRIWPRTWVVAIVLSAFSIGALWNRGELGETFGTFGPYEVAAGVGIGLAWLAATHVGYAILAYVFPTFGAQVADLYRIQGNEPARVIVGPIIAMGIAEELLFRGVLQSQGGFLVGLAAYTVVQLAERKWVLMLAALLGGAVWGMLAWFTDGLVAPIIAHLLWTGLLTLVVPLPAAPQMQEKRFAPLTEGYGD